MNTDAVAEELKRIQRMPYGIARTAAAEAITRRIEAEGPREHLAWALLDLVEAYTFTDQGAKSFVVFARLLRLWDESPELFDASDERNLFWEFKWVAGDLSDFPQITVDQAEAFLADMARRFELAGHGLSSVRMSRFRWAWHTGQPTVEDDRIAWITGLRDEFEDCRACTVGQQVDFFTEAGRYAEAVELGATQTDSCNLEPARTRYALALSALLSGKPELALETYKRARSSDDGEPGDFGPARGQGFELLARGGELEQALRVLRNDHPGLLRGGSSPLMRLRFLLGVLAGLSAHIDGPAAALETGLREEGMRTVAELRAWVLREAMTLAGAFDPRNGNDMYSRLVARAAAATLAEQPLPASTIPASRANAADGDAPPGIPPEASDADAGEARSTADSPDTPRDGASLFAEAERLVSRRAYEAAARAYLDAAAALEREGWIDRAGFANAEAAQCAVLSGDDAAAHALFGAALPLLRTGDADPAALAEVLGAWAPVAARMGDPVPQLTATREELEGMGEADVAGLSDELAERRLAEHARLRASLRDTFARAIAAADPQLLPEGVDRIRAITESRSAGEEFAALGLIADAAHAFWLAGRVQRELGDTSGAIWSLESAFEGFTIARERTARAEAAGELIDLLRQAGQGARAEEIVAEL